MVQVDPKPFPCCDGYPNTHTKDCLVREPFKEVISGILSQQRAQARARGRTSNFEAFVSIYDIHQQLLSRLRGAYAEAITLPTYGDVFNYWLPNLGIQVYQRGSQAILKVELPPPRRAHVR